MLLVVILQNLSLPQDEFAKGEFAEARFAQAKFATAICGNVKLAGAIQSPSFVLVTIMQIFSLGSC